MNPDWWKWGDPKEVKHLDDYPKMKKMLEERWEITLKENFTPPRNFVIPDISEKRKEEIKNTFASISSKRISFKSEDRLKFSLGKSYYDVIRIIDGKSIPVPDVVITPLSHNEVDYILIQASEQNVEIIPFGGGTNVVGALSTDNLKNKSQVKCCLNLQEMNKLIHLDEYHETATFQAGILGPELEDILNKKGFTLGHFPQSFEYSTLGGWVVTRSAGQASTFYGKIEDLTESIKVATPSGTIHTPHFTHDASGINILPLFFGSEGTLGIVTEVTVKIKPLSRHQRWVCALFPSFDAGTQFFKEVIQSGVKPSVIRLSDTNETALFSKLASETHGSANIFDSLKKEAQKLVLKFRNLSEPNLMIMCLEETGPNISSSVVFIKDLVAKYQGMVAPSSIGEKWAEGRFKSPYLRDTLVEHRVFIDTMETYVPWEDVPKLHHALSLALGRCKAFHKEKGYLLCHLSHVYTSGACMYFTYITKMNPGKEVEQWQEIKSVIMECFMQNNGTVSHHHGVGLDHQKWYLKYSDPLTLELLKTVKQKLDPKNILNSGKLFDV